MLNHRHNDFLLYRVSVSEQEKNADVIGKRVGAGIGDTNVANALMGFRLLRHELLAGCEQLLTIVGRQQVSPYPTIEKLLIMPCHKMVVISLCCSGSLFLGRSPRGTSNQAYQTYYTS